LPWLEIFIEIMKMRNNKQMLEVAHIQFEDAFRDENACQEQCPASLNMPGIL
jgi:hypothetical protein